MEDFEEMEMPTPCEHCGSWFDLNDGYGSEKWHPNIIICENCHDEEEKEIKIDERIEELLDEIAECTEQIEWNTENKKQFEIELEELFKINPKKD